jgi:hypothetical protein
MKEKLARIRAPWRRLIITLLINTFLLISRFAVSRRHFHWVGGARRPRRHERALTLLLLIGAAAVLELRQYLYWAVLWGGFFALFVNLYSIYILIPRKQAHWIK